LPIDLASNLADGQPFCDAMRGNPMEAGVLPLVDRAPSNCQQLESALGSRSPKLELRVCGDGLGDTGALARLPRSLVRAQLLRFVAATTG
jgi:hypothetical protein